MISDPKGIDRPIQEMQVHFNDNLWTGLTSSRKSYYARVFRNIKNGELRPEVFEEIGNHYKEVLFDKNVYAMCWFDVEPTTSTFNAGQVTNKVGIVFTVNLDKIYPNLDHRAIEEVHSDVYKILLYMPKTFSVNEVITGREAYGDFDSDMLKNADMQPWHVFRFNCDVSYIYSCK